MCLAPAFCSSLALQTLPSFASTACTLGAFYAPQIQAFKPQSLSLPFRPLARRAYRWLCSQGNNEERDLVKEIQDAVNALRKKENFQSQKKLDLNNTEFYQFSSALAPFPFQKNDFELENGIGDVLVLGPKGFSLKNGEIAKRLENENGDIRFKFIEIQKSPKKNEPSKICWEDSLYRKLLKHWEKKKIYGSVIAPRLFSFSNANLRRYISLLPSLMEDKSELWVLEDRNIRRDQAKILSKELSKYGFRLFEVRSKPHIKSYRYYLDKKNDPYFF